MKTILVLTDFTENAANAAKLAVMLSGEFNANLLLFNTSLMQPVSTYYADYMGGPWAVDDIVEREKETRARLRNFAGSLEPVIAKLGPKQHKPTIRCECDEGSLGENIAKLIQQNHVELIVMGSSTEVKFDHFLNGSDTGSIINHATCPILIVPQSSGFKKLRKIIFATDFDKADIKGLQYVIKLSNALDLKIEVVHISLYGGKDSLNPKEEGFLKHIDKLKYPFITFREARGKDVVQRLNAICNEEGADVLALVHYQHSFFMRLFENSTTKKALSDQNIPLLVFPITIEEE